MNSKIKRVAEITAEAILRKKISKTLVILILFSIAAPSESVMGEWECGYFFMFFPQASMPYFFLT